MNVDSNVFKWNMERPWAVLLVCSGRQFFHDEQSGIGLLMVHKSYQVSKCSNEAMSKTLKVIKFLCISKISNFEQVMTRTTLSLCEDNILWFQISEKSQLIMENIWNWSKSSIVIHIIDSR